MQIPKPNQSSNTIVICVPSQILKAGLSIYAQSEHSIFVNTLPKHSTHSLLSYLAK